MNIYIFFALLAVLFLIAIWTGVAILLTKSEKILEKRIAAERKAILESVKNFKGQ